MHLKLTKQFLLDIKAVYELRYLFLVFCGYFFVLCHMKYTHLHICVFPVLSYIAVKCFEKFHSHFPATLL